MSARGHSSKPWQRMFVTIATTVVGGFMLIFGLWSLLLPRSFGAFIDFPPYNEHLLHDLGARLDGHEEHVNAVACLRCQQRLHGHAGTGR